jgi:hypothetical protein
MLFPKYGTDTAVVLRSRVDCTRGLDSLLVLSVFAYVERLEVPFTVLHGRVEIWDGIQKNEMVH